MRSYYSPIVDPSTLPADLWTKPVPTPGVTIDMDAQLAFIDTELTSYLAEFDPPVHDPGGTARYYLDNPYYGSIDAFLLYAMVRHYKPARVMELGSGFSTLVVAAASRMNSNDGSPFAHTVFDPYAGDHGVAAAALTSVKRVSATQIPMAEFEALAPNDILFVDTTHTVRAAGDVNRLLLEVLPLLKPGVLIHIHDVFLPWEYPEIWLRTFRRNWSEQYLLQALLCENPRFEVKLACHAVARYAPERLRALIPAFQTESLAPPLNGTHLVTPSAFWLRRTGTVSA